MGAKYVFVTGGVVSGLGKGITAASLGRLLKQRGLKVTIQKFDPYLNVYPGLLSPYQHGETFLTDDGAQTDLDLGHYERFIDESLGQYSSVSAGKIYQAILDNEKSGEFNGNTVQVVPHVTNEIKARMLMAAERDPALDVIITEIGGTVGDIEGLPFLEAARQIAAEIGKENCLFIHVVLLPTLGATNEIKTKPAQHSVKELLTTGIQPDVLVCRANSHIDDEIKAKLALFCNVHKSCVVDNKDCASLYEVPLMLHNEGLDSVVCNKLGIEAPEPDLKEWVKLVKNIKELEAKPIVKVALVGKYVELRDSYLSLIESLNHAGLVNGVNVDINFVSSAVLNDKNIAEELSGMQGIIVTGSNGNTGVDGKLVACKYAREKGIPYLGLGFGLHLSVMDFGVNVAGLKEAKPLARADDKFRIGAYPIELTKGTIAQKTYAAAQVSERHRNAYEVNNDLLKPLSQAGLVVSGTSLDGQLVEIMEAPASKFYVAVLFYPEFKSRPTRPHPLMINFIKAVKA